MHVVFTKVRKSEKARNRRKLQEETVRVAEQKDQGAFEG
jgi:hypothetical protein